MKNQTEAQQAAQSLEDKAVVNVKKCENGFTVRVEGKTYIFTNFTELVQFMDKTFNPIKKCGCKGMFHDDNCPERKK